MTNQLHSSRINNPRTYSRMPPSSDKPVIPSTDSHPVGTSVRYIEATEDDAGQRLDNYLIRILKGAPKTLVYRIVRKGEVRVNKKRATVAYRIQSGDTIRIPPVRLPQRGETIKLPPALLGHLEQAILYEDDKLLIINKPSGIAVHGGSGLSYGLIEAIRQIRPGDPELVHRLDRDTSGCLMISKRRSMLRFLHEKLREGDMHKVYHALVVGNWASNKRTINAPLQKNILRSGERVVRVNEEGKPSETHYRVLKNYQDASLVEASPITGRTHQIRVHCLYGGHAILGDEKYGQHIDNQYFRSKGLRRLFLHAAKLTVPRPDGTFLTIEAPLPPDLQKVLKKLDHD
ncbi:Ribosomal large subunit pseudouridine synthase C [invertebrate metagenome]|uniref:Ribosomal large subunit pseudouridine synthase C n=1 Tax=invertebrate metagenome TaxID=1711999 RepID=A0A2H9T8G2_9ZZZZ